MPFSTPARGLRRGALAVLTTLLLVACHGKKDDQKAGNNKKDAGPPLVDVLVARPGQVADSVVANGTVAAQNFVELHPEISGRLTYLQVREGQRVAKGTVIARVFDADLRAQLQKTRALLAVARLGQQRLEKLLAVQGVNRADYDLAVSQVQSNQADAAVIEAQLARTVIRAPFAGRLGLRQVSPGAYVTPATVIATLQADDQLNVDFTLPEAYGGLVRPGARVLVRLDGNPPRRLPATVRAQESQVNQTTRNLTVRARLPAGTVASPGTFARVSVPAGTAQQSVVLPTNAILPGDQSDQVMVVRRGRATLVNVQTGTRQNDQIAVIKGLAAGDSVITNGVLFAQNGKAVRVRATSYK